MRSLPPLLVAALTLTPLFGPAPAHAQGGLAEGGLDLRLFRPPVDSKGLVGLDGADVLGAGDLGFGLILDGGFGLVAHEGFVDDDTAPAGDAARRERLVDQLLTGTLFASLGVANAAVVGLQVPVHLVSGPNVTQPGLYNDGARPAGLDHQGVGDLVLHGKLRLLPVERAPVGLAVALRLGVPTGDETRFAGEAGPWAWPSLVAELRPVRPLRVVMQLGYRWVLGGGGAIRVGGRTEPAGAGATQARWDATRPGVEVRGGDTITAGVGASLRILAPVDLVVEARAAQLANGVGEPRSLAAEALAGLKVFVERNSYLTLAAGTGLGEGVSSPDVRAVVGFVFEPSIGDRDGDGLRDDVDACPDEPEDFDGWEDEDGCPDPDNDRDGILDVDDACPNVPEDRDGDADEDGCPEGQHGDRDGDGILDVDDACPDDPEDRDGWEDEDGCPDPDNDGDGILDVNDLCPNDPEDLDGWEDEDGCPDPDNDGDGILDVDDECPNEPERYNGYLDEDGCDDRGILEVGTGGFLLFEQIHFETDSARILPRSGPLLDAIAAAMNGHPHITLVEIQGHADERGSDDYNLRLTQDRAAAVRQALIDRGVRADRMRSAGYGERCPLDRRRTPAAWQKNRRVEIKILATTEGPVESHSSCQ